MKDIRLPEIRFCIIYLTEVLLRFDRHTILYHVHHIHCEPRAYDIIAASHFYPPNIFFPHYNIYIYRYYIWNTINGVCKTRDASTLSTVYTRHTCTILCTNVNGGKDYGNTKEIHFTARVLCMMEYYIFTRSFVWRESFIMVGTHCYFQFFRNRCKCARHCDKRVVERANTRR
jgi:hypothetical protein